MILPIKPDFYYAEGNIPVFKPSEQQFSDFSSFINQVLPYGKEVGIIKVIPPDTWNGKQLDLDSKLKNFKIKKPIQQNFLGSSGIYKQTNIESRKEFNVKEFEALCSSRDYSPPKLLYKRQRDYLAIKEAQRSGSEGKGIDKSDLLTPPNSSPPGIHLPDNRSAAPESSFYTNSAFTHGSVVESGRELSFYQLLLTELDFKEIERHYWRNISFLPPYYGADLLGSLFDDSVKHWNLLNLEDLLQTVGKVLPGVNSPYLYFGMWRATFAWHVEDMDLFSINYIHRGAPKQWYAIPPSHKERFERVMKGIFSETHEGCPEFLRHKTCLVSPKVLVHNNIPVNRLVQYEGEFVITFPYGYHAGYNIDFNIAESVNFATEYWIDIGARAKPCECLDDNVKIDMRIFERTLHSSDEMFENKGISSTPPKFKTTKRKLKKNPLRSPLMSVSSNSPSLRNRLTYSNLGLQPDGRTWLNNTDELVKKLTPKCILCNDRAGDIIPSPEGNVYAHRICAQYFPGVVITPGASGGCEVLNGLDTIILKQRSRRCYRCRKLSGATISCCEPGCLRTFHVTCTKAHKLIRECTNGLPCVAFCVSHGPKSHIVNYPKVLVKCNSDSSNSLI